MTPAKSGKNINSEIRSLGRSDCFCEFEFDSLYLLYKHRRRGEKNDISNLKHFSRSANMFN